MSYIHKIRLTEENFLINPYTKVYTDRRYQNLHIKTSNDLVEFEDVDYEPRLLDLKNNKVYFKAEMIPLKEALQKYHLSPYGNGLLNILKFNDDVMIVVNSMNFLDFIADDIYIPISSIKGYSERFLLYKKMGDFWKTVDTEIIYSDKFKLGNYACSEVTLLNTSYSESTYTCKDGYKVLDSGLDIYFTENTNKILSDFVLKEK